MSSLFNELKRRNVFRVAAAYLVIRWLLVQVLGLAANSFEAPAWVMKMIITLLVIGFIPAILFSWAYELTPEGLKKDSEVDSEKSSTLQTANKLNTITLLAVLAAGGMFAYQQMNPVSQTHISEKSVIQTTGNDSDSRLRRNDGIGGGSDEKDAGNSDGITINNDDRVGVSKFATIKEVDSIAVLPFVNMSSDKDQEYFADGISEEILNALVKATSLRVAGRTSSFSFKGKNKTIKEIGEALNVALFAH